MTLAFPVAVQAQETVYEAVFDRYEFASSSFGDQFCRPFPNAPLTLNGDTITFNDRYPCASGLNVTGTVTFSRPDRISGSFRQGEGFVLTSPVTAGVRAQATFQSGTAALHKTRAAAGIKFQEGSNCTLQPSDETGMGPNSTITKEGSGTCTLDDMDIEYEADRTTPKRGSFIASAFVTVQTTPSTDSIILREVFAFVYYRFGPPQPTSTITGLDQKVAARGSSILVNIRGEQFAAGAVVQFLDSTGAVDPQMVVTGVNVVSANEIQANLSVDPNAALGPRRVRVTSGGASGTSAGPLLDVIALNLRVSLGARTGPRNVRIANHPTVVRAGIEGTLQTSGTSLVRGRLYVFDGEGQIAGSPFEPNKPKKIGANEDSLEPGSPSAEDLCFMRDTLNFYFGMRGDLPTHNALEAGRYSFLLAVSPTAPQLTPAGDASLTKAALKARRDLIVVDSLPEQNFVKTRPLRLIVVIDPRLDDAAADALLNRHRRDLDYVAAAFPLDGSKTNYVRKRLRAQTALDINALKPSTPESVVWHVAILDRLASMLSSVNNKLPANKHFDKITLFLDPATSTEIMAGGVGWGHNPGVASMRAGGSESVLSHELGHNFGLKDEYKKAIPESSPLPNPRRSDADDNANFVEVGAERLWPLQSAGSTYLAATASVNEDGITLPDVPYRIQTFMGAEFPNKWTDFAERKHLYDQLRLPAAAGGTRTLAAATGEVVYVQGVISTSDQVAVTRLARGSAAPVATEPGDFVFELLDSAGNAVSASSFGVNFQLPHGGPGRHALFSVTAPFVGGAVMVRIRKGSEVLYSHPISASAPEVQILSPAGGEAINGPFTIAWGGADPDGDPLTYSIAYLPDDESAVPIADGLTGTTFHWADPSLEGGTLNGRIVVTANDGVHETSAMSGLISVARQGPSVTILEPRNGVAVPAGTQVTLSGAGSDAEDGLLPAESLRFRSSIDGDLETGAAIAPMLSQGVHTITLLGVDSDGGAAEASITIDVGPASAVPVLGTVSPAAAHAGSAVTLSGRNFTSGATVKFGNTAASVVSVNASQIVVTVPSGLALGQTEIFVTSGGHSTNHISFNVTYGRPFLFSVTPNSGGAGTPVFLGGAEFATSIGGNTVRFGSVTATVLGAGLDGLLVAVPGGLSEGTVNVTAATAQGLSDPLPFTVTGGPPSTPVIISSISPPSAPVGAIVTINGSGFSNALQKNAVNFGGIAVTPINGSGASLQVAVPFGLSAGTINLIVTVNGYPSNPLPFAVSPETTPTPSPNGCVPPPQNLVAWWPGDGNANDIQNGNNGTLQGGATFAQGKVNQAFSLNPSTSNGSGSDFVSFGNPAALKLTGSLTVDAWINTNDFQQGKLIEIVTKWGQNFTCGFPNTDSFILGLDKPGATIRLVGIIHTSNPNQEPSIGGGIITPGQLTHVAMTYDAATGTFAIYVNGAVVNSTIVATGGICTSDLNVMVGSEDSFQGPSRRFSGLIDEVDIFDRALSAGEIQAIFNAGSGGKCKGTITPGPGRVREVQNISTRVVVGTGENVAIGGFIVLGNGSKRVIVRAIGPSLANFGVGGALEDPTLELFNGSGSAIAFNDDWPSSAQNQEIAALLPPGDGLEAAVIASLTPGNYTAVLRGYENGTGIALVEVYDLDQGAPSRLANISTRGQVGTGGSVLIGGFIVGKQAQFVVRAIGPSLGAAGIGNALGNPVLDLYNAQGDKFDTNDNWQDNPSSNQVSGLGLAPINALESAVIHTLPAGNYTAIVRGFNDGVGVGLVEVYNTTSSP